MIKPSKNTPERRVIHAPNKYFNVRLGSLCKVTNYEKRWLCKPVSEMVSWHCTTRKLCIIKTFLGLAIMCLEPDREGASSMVPGSARVLELSLLVLLDVYMYGYQ